MICKECYVWEMRLDNLIDKWKNLPKFFAYISVELFSEMSLQLIKEKNSLYEIRNEECPAQRCRLL